MGITILAGLHAAFSIDDVRLRTPAAAEAEFPPIRIITSTFADSLDRAIPIARPVVRQASLD
jgi:hypothetical protein